MKTASVVRASPFGKRPVSVATVKKPPPPPTKKIVAKKIKKIKKVESEEPAEDLDEDDDQEEEQPAISPREQRQLALQQAPKLGIQNFEADRHLEHDLPSEDFLDESPDAEDRQENLRKNDDRIASPGKVSGAVTTRRVRNLATVFGQRADVIMRLLDSEDDTDGALTLIHRTLLQTLVDVLPVVERGVRRSKGRRGVIPMNQLVSQIRELVTDIQSLRDKGQLGASIIDRTVRPAYLDLASQIAVGFMEIENSAKTRMPTEDFHSFRDDVLLVVKKGLAQYIQGQYETIKNDVVNSLS